jgi:hypothetical protein
MPLQIADFGLQIAPGIFATKDTKRTKPGFSPLLLRVFAVHTRFWT